AAEVVEERPGGDVRDLADRLDGEALQPFLERKVQRCLLYVPAGGQLLAFTEAETCCRHCHTYTLRRFAVSAQSGLVAHPRDGSGFGSGVGGSPHRNSQLTCQSARVVAVSAVVGAAVAVVGGAWVAGGGLRPQNRQ